MELTECPRCQFKLDEEYAACPSCHTLFDTDDPALKPLPPAEPLMNQATKVYDDKGPGRRQCPKCNKYVHARYDQCLCGFTFEPEPKRDIPPGFYGRGPRIAGLQRVMAPAGEAPFKLHSLDEESILAWCEKTKAHFRDQGMDLLDEGVVYFAKYQYDFQSDEFKKVKSVIMGQYS